MGKGDKKTRRGKIILGTYGVRRRRKIEDKPAVQQASLKKEPGERTARETKPTPEIKETRQAKVKEAKEEKAVKTAAKTTEPKPVKNKKVTDEEKAAEAKPVKAKKAEH